MRKPNLAALVFAVAAGAVAFGSAQATERGGRGRSGEVEKVCALHPDRAAHEAKFADFLA